MTKKWCNTSPASEGKKPLEELAPHKATAFTFTKQEVDPLKEKKPTSIPLKPPDPPKEQFKEVTTEKGPTPFNLQEEQPMVVFGPNVEN